MSRSQALAHLLLGLVGLTGHLSAQQVKSTAYDGPNFESGPTRPILFDPELSQLYVLNTPYNRVEVYKRAPSLRFVGHVFTGLEPVSMALHPTQANLLFVANHLSDTVTVVDVEDMVPVGLIQVGDEPSDLIIESGKLFVSCSRAPSLVSPGSWDENVIVTATIDEPYMVTNQVVVAGHKPRALAAANGKVYAAVLNSGNHTTILDEGTAVSTYGLTQDVLDSHDLGFNFVFNDVVTKPELFLSPWGTLGGTFPFGIGWSLPTAGRIVLDSEYPNDVTQLLDEDLFEIDPASLSVTGVTTGVGTTLLGMATNPVANELWIANTDANNRTRMEYLLQGASHKNQVTIVKAGGTQPAAILSLAPPTTAVEHAQPVAVAFHSGASGAFAYVAAMGTDTVLVLDPLNRSVLKELPVGPIPLGLAVDPNREMLYVFTRGDKSITVFDIRAGHTAATVPRQIVYDSEVAGVNTGREHLYSAKSDGHGNGNVACSSCHVFSHMDGMAWDLGDSSGALSYIFPDTLAPDLPSTVIAADPSTPGVNPMKGPMVTQSLRGVKEGEPFHWRGDRRFLHNFRRAYEDLLGGSRITSAQMQEFSTFARSVEFGPNPYEPKNRSYTGAAADGLDLFGMNPSVPAKPYTQGSTLTCILCHQGDFPNKDGFRGDRLTIGFDGDSQFMNTTQLRGLYEKNFKSLTGFGTSHDGHLDGVRGFLDVVFFFVFPGMRFDAFTPQDKDDVSAFVNAWDTGMPPSVGLSEWGVAANIQNWNQFLDLAESQATIRDVDLVLSGYVRSKGGVTKYDLLWSFDAAAGRWRYLVDTGSYIDRNVLNRFVTRGVFQALGMVVPVTRGYAYIDHDVDFVYNNLEAASNADPENPDTDGDGYWDSTEIRLGTPPDQPDPFVPDVTAPSIVAHNATQVFTDTATIHIVTMEPCTARVEVGTSPGTSNVGTYASTDMMLVHDVILTRLPAGTPLFYEITVADKNNNSRTAAGGFTTGPARWRIQRIQMLRTGAGPDYVLTAHVWVEDHDDVPIAGIDVRGLFESSVGDLGVGTPWDQTATTDGTGRASFTLNYTLTAPSAKITFSPAFVGSLNPVDPYFVGFSGDVPSGFYFQVENTQNFAEVSLP